MAVSVLTNVKTDPTNGIFHCILTTASSEGATAIFPGFTPRLITMTQVGGSADATFQSSWCEGMTAAYASLIGNTGTASIITSAGYTPLTGTETATVIGDIAAASPKQSGQGFIVGTGVQANSLVYSLTAYR